MILIKYHATGRAVTLEVALQPTPKTITLQVALQVALQATLQVTPIWSATWSMTEILWSA